MVEVGGRPILWHIIQLYAAQGFRDFVICLGYKGWVIKEYFLNYHYHRADLTVQVDTGRVTVHQSGTDAFTVTLVETGEETQTAGRLRRIQPYLGQEPFMLTYGDGVSDVDLHALLAFHQQHGKVATMTAVQPGSRFGVFEPDENGAVAQFREKPQDDGNWINGGFFVLNPQVFDYLAPGADDMPWERQPLSDLATAGQLSAYRHTGFWKCLDTLRDAQELNTLWQTGHAPWKRW